MSDEDLLTLPTVPNRVAYGFDAAAGHGLEIGPLSNPRLRKDQADIRYLDHLTPGELREKYPDDDLTDLVDVDFVWTPGRSLVDVLGEWAPLDYVIASHVIEHVANPIAWLSQVDETLAPGGVLSLVVPDSRYCFDARRPPTTLGPLVDLYLRDVQVTTYAQVFDFFSLFLRTLDQDQLWAGANAFTDATVAEADLTRAWRKVLTLQRTGEYFDTHATVFTPLSFLEIVAHLGILGLTSFAVTEIFPTEENSYEFFVTLQTLRDLPASERRAQQDRGIERARHRVQAFEAALQRRRAPKPPPAPEPVPVPVSVPAGFAVTPREQRLIELKRRAVNRVAHRRG